MKNRVMTTGSGSIAPARNDRKVVLFCTSPFSLWCGMAFLRQRGVPSESVVAVDYKSALPPILDAESWMAESAGAAYHRREADWFEPFLSSLGKGRLEKILRLPFWRKDRRAFVTLFSFFVDINDVTDIVLPFRMLLEEVLLAMAFPRARRHFIPDGYLLDHAPLRLSPLWKARGVNNPYTVGKRPIIWTPASLENRLSRFGSVKRIEADAFESVAEDFRKRPDWDGWLKENGLLRKGAPFTVFLGQNLFARQMADPMEELSVYGRILLRELEESENRILVKLHPRDNEARRSLLDGLIPARDKRRVTLLPIDRFSNLPVELLFDRIGIARVAGIATTSILTARTEGLETRIYDAVEFAPRLREDIRRLAEENGLERVVV